MISMISINSKFSLNSLQVMQAPSIKTIEELENELQFLKQKQKKYDYLGKKMIQLQATSKYISKEAQKMDSIITVKQLDQQQQVKNLKTQIEQTVTRNKHLENQRNKIQNQIRFSSAQLQNLQQLLENIQVSNRQRKLKVDIKQEEMKQYKLKLQKIREQRSRNQVTMASLRHQIKQLQDQTGKYSIQIQAVHLKRKEQQKACEKLKQQVNYNQAKINVIKRQIQQEKAGIRHYEQTKRTIKQVLQQYQFQELKMREKIDLRKKELSRLVQQASSCSSRFKILQQQLQNGKNDMKSLYQQYQKECLQLEKQQQRNFEINMRIDQAAIQASELWCRVQDQILSKYQKNEEANYVHRDYMDTSLQHRQHTRLIQIWKQIQKIIKDN